MNTCHLFIVTNADPRRTGRAAEAARIAAGVGAWNKVQVDLYLMNAALLGAAEFPEELVDGNLFTEYLPAIEKHGGHIYADKDSPLLKTIVPAVRLSPASKEELDASMRAATYVMQFC